MVALTELLSVAVTTTENGLPELLAGVPEITPVPELIVMAAGNPVADQV